MAAQVPDQPWKAAKADQWDSETVETFVEANAHTADARWLTQLIIESVYGAEAADVSLLDLLSTIRSVGGNVFTLVGSAQSTRFVGGTQQLSQRLAAELGGRVVLGAPVRAIHHHRSGSLVVESARGEWQAKRVPGRRAAAARRPDRVPAAAPSLPLPARPAPADGDGDQVQRPV